MRLLLLHLDSRWLNQSLLLLLAVVPLDASQQQHDTVILLYVASICALLLRCQACSL